MLMYKNTPVGVSTTQVVEKDPLHIYSREEHVVGRWIDGRPVYEITQNVHKTNTHTDYYPFEHFGVGDVDLMVNGTAIALIANGDQSLVPNNVANISISKERQAIVIWSTNANWQRIDWIVTVQYTKTTDTSTIFVNSAPSLKSEGSVSVGDKTYDYQLPGSASSASAACSIADWEEV